MTESKVVEMLALHPAVVAAAWDYTHRHIQTCTLHRHRCKFYTFTDNDIKSLWSTGNSTAVSEISGSNPAKYN